MQQNEPCSPRAVSHDILYITVIKKSLARARGIELNYLALVLHIILFNKAYPVLVHSVVMILMHKLHLGKRGKFDPDKNSWHLSVSSLSAYF